MKGLPLFIVASVVALGTLMLEYFRYASVALGSWIWVVSGFVVAGSLLWTRRDELLQRSVVKERKQLTERIQGDPRTIILLGVVGLTLAFAAQLAHSPYLGWLTFLYLLGVAVYGEFGQPGVVAIRPILILLIFLNPIPIPYEPWSALALQSTSTSLTAIMLDFLRIFFFSEGNVLGLISEQKLFPELFQGVSWLFPTIFIAIAWGIHHRYGWTRTTVNVFQAVGWVIVGNAAGATILLANKQSGGNWLDFPSVVALWDYVKFVAILFFTWSGDQFLASTLRSTFNESSFEEAQKSGAVPLLPLRWKLAGVQFGLVVGLFLVCGLSIRLSDYHPGMLPTHALAKSLELPSQIDSWKVEQLDSPETPVWLPAGSSVRSWILERDGKKMVLEVTQSATTPKPYLYSWLWTGWRLENAPDFLDTDEAGNKPMMAQLARLPGEVCTVLAWGTDQYGSPLIATSALERGGELPGMIQGNLLKALGKTPSKPEKRNLKIPPSCNISLSVVSSRQLDSTMFEELKQCWAAVIAWVNKDVSELTSR
jgi:hypothetical protein